LNGLDFDEKRVDIVHTTQTIDMDDPPVKAIQKKTDSSMVVALNLLKDDPDAMLISAGSTGALVAGATLIVKRVPGIKRPALAPVLPTVTGEVMLIDGGANADCKPQYLEQFGIMRRAYYEQGL
jgi:glycerol-3-phosphate acyltransferase PlsX